jgi:hypothetical protein
VSGSGTSFNYNYRHPLTGTSGLFVAAGTYLPIIDKVNIGGIAFSQSGNTAYSNNPVPSLLTCFQSVAVDVDGFRCNNGDGSSDLSQYEHRVNFTSDGNGAPPQELSSTFILSANTNYFAWKFRGSNVPDKLKLTYKGSAYSYTPIVLEYWEVGGDLPSTNVNYNVFPKLADTSSYISKITCLTGFTINDGDTIDLEVIPNTSFTSTSWDFYFGCADTIDCNLNLNLPNKPLKISGDTITVVTGECSNTITFKVSGMTSTDKRDSYLNEYSSQFYVTGTDSNGFSPLYFNGLYYNQTRCYNSNPVYKLNNLVCEAEDSNYFIKYEKSNGFFKLTTDNPTYVRDYYNEYITYIKPNISTFSGDSSNEGYYRYFNIYYPGSTGNEVCGDGTTRRNIAVHQSSIVTTGITGGNYFLQLTLPTITLGLTANICDIDCNNYYNQIVNIVNRYSTGTTYNYTGTTDTSSRFNYLFPYFRSIISTTNNNNIQDKIIYRYTGHYYNKTVPASGSSYTLIPNLSGVTCSSFNTYFEENNNGYSYYYDGHWKVELTNPLDFNDFKIYANTTVETSKSRYPAVWLEIYNYSGGTIHYSDSNYII